MKLALPEQWRIVTKLNWSLCCWQTAMHWWLNIMMSTASWSMYVCLSERVYYILSFVLSFFWKWGGVGGGGTVTLLTLFCCLLTVGWKKCILHLLLSYSHELSDRITVPLVARHHALSVTETHSRWLSGVIFCPEEFVIVHVLVQWFFHFGSFGPGGTVQVKQSMSPLTSHPWPDLLAFLSASVGIQWALWLLLLQGCGAAAQWVLGAAGDTVSWSLHVSHVCWHEPVYVCLSGW